VAALFEESSSNKIQPKSLPQTAGDEIHWIRPDPVDLIFPKKLENALDFGEIQWMKKSSGYRGSSLDPAVKNGT
jgi:hypothetical protein